MRSLEKLEGALIVFVAVVCLGFQLRLPALLPGEADFAAVQQALEAEAQPGDAVLLFPWWAERARLFAPERVTVVGYQGSDADNLERHPRIWVLSQPDLPKASWGWFSSVFSPGRTSAGPERPFGRLHLQLFQNGRHRPTRFSFTDQLAQAKVYLEGPDGARQPCAWDGRAHRCGNGSYVAVEWHEVRFQPRRCLRLYPPGGPSRLVVELAGAPQADALALWGGLVWDRGYFREDRLTDTVLTAEVNGVKAAELVFPRGRYGLQKAEGPQVPEGATVRVSSQALNPELRELCVEAYGFAGSAP